MADSDKDVTIDSVESGNRTGTGGDEALAALQQERDEIYDRLLRTTAEFDNYRKRTDRERRELHEAASADLIRDLLPVVDDFERALAAAETGEQEPAAQVESDEAGSIERFRRGAELIHRQLLEVLRRRGVEPLEAVGRPFDPNWHEAVGHDPAGDRPEGEVTTEVRRGYRIGERLLRPAMVRVARA